MIIRIILVIVIFIYFVFVNVDYVRLRKKCQELENRMKTMNEIDEIEKNIKDVVIEEEIVNEINADHDISNKD